MGEYRDLCELRDVGSGMWESEFGERLSQWGHGGAQEFSVDP